MASAFSYGLKTASQQHVVHTPHDSAAMLSRQADDHTTTTRMMLQAQVEIVNAFTNTERQGFSHGSRGPAPTPADALGSPHLWNICTTVEFLKTAGYADHAAYFQKEGYNGEVLLGLTAADLEDMPIGNNLVRRALLCTVARLVSNTSSV
jgi:hypothetical protein